ncbi:GNAT family N-acetyltransferase [Labilibaculum sp.]|uniref:GNAT family N-acetyltransferase n=1 Tax=Labilibaculum sp. TaxID=2060723 RepID=UPI00356B1A8F
MNLKLSILEKSHDRSDFNCGKELLDDYVKKQASQDIKKRLSVCFVLSDANDIVKGYYTLSNSSIPQKDIPEKFSKHLPNSYKDIPVTLLGRLAIDKSIFRKGQGEYLLMDALKESYKVSKQTIGSMAVVVDPIDEEAVLFYKKYGFIELPGSGKMFLPMNTIAKVFPDI